MGLRIAWSGARRRPRLARLCTCLAVAGVVAAMAQPSVAVAPTQREGILELVIDVSGSTSADDVAPTRLAAIQGVIVRLLDKVPRRVRVGLVSFSDRGRSLALPTADRGAVRRQIGALSALGGTSIDDALRHALNDIGSSHPPAPAQVLLISDGASTAGGDPVDVARIAAARHVQVLTIALGTPDGTVSVVDETGKPRRVPIPPDPVQLNRIAAASGGRAVVARSASELATAVEDLLVPAILGPDQRDLTLLFAAVALLLLAIGRTLTPSPRVSAAASGAPLPAVVWRWTLPVALVVGAAAATAGWARLLPGGFSPANDRAAAIAGLAPQPLPVAPAPPSISPPFVTVAATKADRTLVQQAGRLLRGQGALAPQRTTEIRRRHLTPIAELEVSACDVCVTGALTSPGSGNSTIGGQTVCEMTLNTPFARRQAMRARVPVRMLVAMAMLHEQELCLHTRVPYASEQRLAAKLHNPLLLDLLYAQIEAGQHDWNTVLEAVVILRDHGELAFQRHDDIKRRHLNQVGPLWITVCRGCLEDLIGQASADSETGGITGCDIELDLSGLERDARDWGLPVGQVTASTLVHEQEHCVRDPDDRETPAIDEERRLAMKMGSARLLEYAASSYSDLDSSGHWKS
jgi:Ca-activated chloride channel family protein